MAVPGMSAHRTVKLRIVPQAPVKSDKPVMLKITEHFNETLFMGQLKRQFNLDLVPDTDVTLKDGEYDQPPSVVLAALPTFCKDADSVLPFDNCTMGEHEAEVELGISTFSPIGKRQPTCFEI